MTTPTTVVGVINRSLVLSFAVYNASPPVEDVVWIFVNSSGHHHSISSSGSDKYLFSADLLSVNITFIEISDEGNYSILVQNSAGSSSAAVMIDIQGM